MNRLGFLILSILQQGGATGKLSSMTLREIAEAEDLGIKENTIFKKLRDFESAGCIGRGLKEGRADTFFITQKGSRILEEERRLT